MSTFSFENFLFKYTSYSEFVSQLNIFNNELANQENLNKAVNRLKREMNHLLGQFKILTNSEMLRWEANLIYEPGEIVSYIKVDEPTDDDIKNSYYIAIPTDEKNLAYEPDKYPNFWMKVTLNDIYPWLDLENYPMKNGNKEDWTISQDFDVVNLKYLVYALEEFKTFLDSYQAGIYIKIDNMLDLEITKPTHVTTKKYVDDEINALAAEITNLDKLLEDYIFVDPATKQMKTKKTNVDFIKTTDMGFLPGKNNVSQIGNAQNIFKSMYANDFIGTALRAKYADLAEIYECDNYGDFKPGDVVGITYDGDFVLSTENCESILGVVSDKPGFILNNDKKGIIIALKGQTPVKVKGKIRKGSHVFATSDGCARAGFRYEMSSKAYLYLGVALESSDVEDIKLVNIKV